MAGGDHFVHGRHADQVGPQRAQHPHLRRRLVARAGEAGVDPFGELEAEAARLLVGEGAQRRVVGVDHVGEAGAPGGGRERR